jgi:hypothetical protein
MAHKVEKVHFFYEKKIKPLKREIKAAQYHCLCILHTNQNLLQCIH